MPATRHLIASRRSRSPLKYAVSAALSRCRRPRVAQSHRAILQPQQLAACAARNLPSPARAARRRHRSPAAPLPIGVGSRSRLKSFRRLRAHRSFPVRLVRRRPTDAGPHRRATAARARRERAVRRAMDAGRPASAIARSRPMSAAGNASGSRNSRIAMYCAVHSPMPGSARSFAIASSRLAPRLKIAGSSAMTCASALAAFARAPGMPSDSKIGGSDPRRRRETDG